MATPTKFSYTIQDNDGVKATALVYVSYNGAVGTVDALIGTWLSLGGLIDAVTGGEILSGSITIPLAPDAAWKDTPLTGQSVSDVLTMNFSNDDTIYQDGVTIPALRDTLVVDGRPVLTPAGAIDTLADAIAGSFTNGYYVNENGSDLIALISAFQAVRKHRKQLKARSTVVVP